jgi:hypothetical protein
MAESSTQLDARSRKNCATILKGLASAGQAKAAEAIERDESAVSRMKDKDIPALAKLLAVCGLKVVPEGVKCYDPNFIGAVLYLAKGQLAKLENPTELEWDE